MDKFTFISPKILIQITTRDAPANLINNSVEHILQAIKNVGLQQYRIWVVTDTPGFAHPAVETIFVPKTFTANCKYKARALEYAKRERKRLGLTGKDWWIYYLDEENIVSAQALEALIKYINVHGEDRPVACGAITYVRSRSVIAHLCDSIRLLGYVEAHFYMRYFGYFYLQGENTLVRSDIEQAAGWELGDTLTEDLLYGIEIRSKTKAKFGWHGGTIKSLSPETLQDFMKQRRRWYCGGLQGLFRRHMPFWQRIHLGYRLGIWTLGFFTLGLGLVVILFHNHVPLWALITFIPTSALFPVVYFTGALADGISWPLAILIIPVIPLFAFFETSAAIYGAVKPAHGFDIIRKQPLLKPTSIQAAPEMADDK